jgi:hypothetical protein
LLKKTASENLVSTGGFLKQPYSPNVISTGGCKTTVSENADFYWPLALAEREMCPWAISKYFGGLVPNTSA